MFINVNKVLLTAPQDVQIDPAWDIQFKLAYARADCAAARAESSVTITNLSNLQAKDAAERLDTIRNTALLMPPSFTGFINFDWLETNIAAQTAENESGEVLKISAEIQKIQTVIKTMQVPRHADSLAFDAEIIAARAELATARARRASLQAAQCAARANDALEKSILLQS